MLEYCEQLIALAFSKLKFKKKLIVDEEYVWLRTIVMQLAHILFYRMFILTSSRVEYYESIGRQLLKSICQQTVANYGYVLLRFFNIKKQNTISKWTVYREGGGRYLLFFFN